MEQSVLWLQLISIRQDKRWTKLILIKTLNNIPTNMLVNRQVTSSIVPFYQPATSKSRDLFLLLPQLRQTFTACFELRPQMNKHIDLPVGVKVDFLTHSSVQFPTAHSIFVQLYSTVLQRLQCLTLLRTFSSEEHIRIPKQFCD